MKIPRPKIKITRLRVRRFYIFFSFYFAGAAIAHLVMGHVMMAISNIFFFACVAVYFHTTKVMDQQQALLKDVMASNDRLLQTLQAEAYNQTLETLERKRRATWS